MLKAKHVQFVTSLLSQLRHVAVAVQMLYMTFTLTLTSCDPKDTGVSVLATFAASATAAAQHPADSQLNDKPTVPGVVVSNIYVRYCCMSMQTAETSLHGHCWKL